MEACGSPMLPCCDRFSMCDTFLQDCFESSIGQAQDIAAFCGDSPNDEPLFEKFKFSFGVANIKNFSDSLKHPPSFVSKSDGGQGFVEIAKKILEKKS